MRSFVSAAVVVAVAGGALVGASVPAGAASNPHRPGVISLSPASVAEDAKVGTVVGKLTSADNDTKHRHTFTLVGGKGSDDNGLFKIDGRKVLVAGGLDYETDAKLTIRVKVTDLMGRTRANAVKIAVRDVVEESPVLSLTGSSVAENQPSGTAVGTLSTAGAKGTSTYSLVSGAGFAVSGDRLVTAAAFDFEAGSSYPVKVQAVTVAGTKVQQTFTVTVTNVNEAPTGIALSPNSVSEGQVNALVGTLSASDPDAGDSHSFALVSGAGDADNTSFQVVGSELRTVVPLHYDNQSVYSVRIRATDAGGATYETALSVNALQVPKSNHAPYHLTLSNDTVEENKPAETLVGQLNASDDDGDELTYSLVSGGCHYTVARSACRSPFTPYTVTADGRVLTSDDFDYEIQTYYRSSAITVRATDPGGLYTEETFTISLEDVNEAPTGAYLTNNDFDRSSSSGLIGSIIAVDQDSDDTHTFTLVGAVNASSTDFSEYFAIVGNELQVLQYSCEDWVPVGTYTVTVEVEDAGGLSDQFDLTVTVTEAPPRIAHRC